MPTGGIQLVDGLGRGLMLTALRCLGCWQGYLEDWDQLWLTWNTGKWASQRGGVRVVRPLRSFMVPGDTILEEVDPTGFLRPEPGNGHIAYAIVVLAGSKENYSRRENTRSTLKG